MYRIKMVTKRGRAFIITVKADCLLEAVDQAIRSLGDIYQEEDFNLPEFVDVVRIYGEELA